MAFLIYIFSSYQSISDSSCFLFCCFCRSCCMQHNRAIWSFCKVNEGGSFHAKGNGQYGNRSQLIIFSGCSIFKAECRIGCSLFLRLSTWLWSTLMKAGVKSLSWMKGGAHQREKNLQLLILELCRAMEVEKQFNDRYWWYDQNQTHVYPYQLIPTDGNYGI